MLRFLTLSLLFHGIAIGAWHYTRPWHTENSHGTVLAITLMKNMPDRESTAKHQPPGIVQETIRSEHGKPAAHGGIPGTEAATSPRRKTLQSLSAAHNFSVTEKTAATVLDSVENTGIPAGNATPAAALTDSTENNSSSIKAIKAAVALAFQANFSYPRIARRNDWEGTVTLTLRVLPNGLLDNVLVSESSGFPALDNAARKTMQLASVPEARQQLNGKPIDIIVPVIYQLTDS